jgi:hypothetical protein
MKSKIFVLGAFFVILMFLSFNVALARDPTPKYRTNKSHGYGGGNKGGNFDHKGTMHLPKEQKRFERAKRKAWADGRLTYTEMRRLHQLEKKARRPIHQLKQHGVPYHHIKRSHISHGHKWHGFPGFSIMFSFSDPNSHVAGSFGVK